MTAPALPVYLAGMDLIVSADGNAHWDALRFRCAIGPAGTRLDKREGDGATPVGRFAFRYVLYRPDRLAAPRTSLPVRPLAPDHGWCDDPADPHYNRPVRLPYAGRHEALWRDDGVYDVVTVIGHNDDPPVPGRGSAVFLHVARPDYGPTEGCVALALDDLLAVLAQAGPADGIQVKSG